MLIFPVPGPAVVKPPKDLVAAESLFLLHGGHLEQAGGTDLARVQYCLRLIFDHMIENGSVRFGSRLFSEVCRYVERRGETVNSGWAEAYRAAWKLFLDWQEPARTFPDARSIMKVGELPLGVPGFVAPYGPVHYGQPNLVDPDALVWSAPTALALARIIRPVTPGQPAYTLELPPGEPQGADALPVELLYDVSLGY